MFPRPPSKNKLVCPPVLAVLGEWRDRQQRALTASVHCSALAFIGLRAVSKLMPIFAYTRLPKRAPFSKTFEAAWAEQSGFSQCQSWFIMPFPGTPGALQSVFPLHVMMLVEGRMDVLPDGSL